ncbi:MULTISPECIES: HGGxSTG domain-containing protein [unclassified Streptomyces]|uniref:HGGxSTG domain-containing protein n=1 Tax=unclassified Streptomyces TaxID=2593676 RepID=UPI0033B1D52D
MARTQSPCGARTKSGGTCRRLAMVGAGRCNLHRADWATYPVERFRERRERQQERERRNERLAK